MDNVFSIQARPTDACSPNLSASMHLGGPIHMDRRENQGTYMIFGDNKDGNIFGRRYEVGSYRISSMIDSGPSQSGDIVVDGAFEFAVSRTADAAFALVTPFLLILRVFICSFDPERGSDGADRFKEHCWLNFCSPVDHLWPHVFRERSNIGNPFL